ncbi:MAG: FAD-dependent oxidoreductase, partial [Anaerolineae bacterium]
MTAVVLESNKADSRSTLRRHVFIIGGGISGLSAAWYLQQQSENQGLDIGY